MAYYALNVLSRVITLLLFSDAIFLFCHSCMPRNKWSFKVRKDQLRKLEPIPSTSLNTKFVYVDTEASLARMVSDLKNVDELAVDSEFHSVRSFQGVTCTLQLSSRTKDYIVDAIALKDKLEVLNKILANPKVVKVLHDASNDVLWLEKDLKLNLVNVFDTFLAATALNTTQRGYAYLVKHFCNVDIEKQRVYQAYYDWRRRPLSRPAIAYARKDTHFLLWLYDIMRNALIDRGNGTTALLMEVYDQGVKLCKEKFKESTAKSCYDSVMRKREVMHKRPLDSRQLFALKSLCQWRDTTARNLDESVGYVMPSKLLISLVERLPARINDLLELCKPGPIPVYVQKNLQHIYRLIRKARYLPSDEQKYDYEQRGNFGGKPKKVWKN